MRALDKRLDMSQSNLYNYYSSKRMLWFEIMRQDFTELRNQIQPIVLNHKGTSVELLEHLTDFYFDFAESNYRRYKLMFVLPPPPAEGQPSEDEKFIPQKTLKLLNLIESALSQGLSKDIDSNKLSLYLWSIIHGTVLLTNTILFDPGYKVSNFGSKDEFKKFVKEQLKQQLRQITLV